MNQPALVRRSFKKAATDERPPDPSLRLLDYGDIAELMSLGNAEAARKLCESVPELARLKLKIGRRARFREVDFRKWLDGLSGQKGGTDA